MERDLAGLEHHFIVCGYGRMGQRVCHEFSLQGIPFVVLERNQHLLEGFERGRSNESSLSLRDESSKMHERRSFYRVYWAGAALAFLTDVEARRTSGPTLDSALQAFAACCAASEEDWNAERVLAHLDRSLGAPHFTEQARRWLDRREFPALDGVLRSLGVAPGPRGEAIFGPALNAAIRDAIMAPAPLPAAR